MSTPPHLTDEEKIRIRAACGYMSVTDAYVMSMGIPSAQQTAYLIEGAMNRVQVAALALLRNYLGKYEAVEEQMFENTEAAVVESIGDIRINPKEFEQLRDQRLVYWRAKICNLLGVVPNPFQAVGEGAPSINARVIG